MTSRERLRRSVRTALVLVVCAVTTFLVPVLDVPAFAPDSQSEPSAHEKLTLMPAWRLGVLDPGSPRVEKNAGRGLVDLRPHPSPYEDLTLRN